MSKGRRYEENRQLNMKKVYGVVGAFLLIIAICVITRIALTGDENDKITSQTYFSSFYANKWGVINSKGENIIEPSYVEMIIVPNEKEDVFLCTYDVDYDNATYKTKVIDSSESEIYTNYDKVEALQNKDSSNNLWYEKEVLRVQKNEMYGLIELSTGKTLLDCEYESIECLFGTENAFVVVKDGKIGVVDNKGTQIVEPMYSEITNIGTDNKDGYIVKTVEGKYGVVDYSNKVIIEPKYDEISSVYSEEYYVVVLDGNEQVIDKSEEVVLSNGFDKVAAILKSGTGIVAIKDEKYGVIDFEGNEIFKFEYSNLKETSKDVFTAQNDGKYGIISKDGELLLGYDYTYIRYSELADIYIADVDNINSKIYNGNYEQQQEGVFMKIDETAGYIQMKQDSKIKYYNFKFEEKEVSDINQTVTLCLMESNGKFGYTDASGEEVVEAIYDDAKEQNSYGYAAVKKNGKWGSIDSIGNVVVEPIYNLDDYLIIDFIGQWHLGKDLNNSLYNQLDK